MSERSKNILATEWDLLEALWRSERATVREITEAVAEKRGWALSTVKTMLDRMAAKGLVNARQVGTVWEYTPGVAPIEARRGAWHEFIEKAFGGASTSALHFLATDAKLSKKEFAVLRAMLADKEEK